MLRAVSYTHLDVYKRQVYVHMKENNVTGYHWKQILNSVYIAVF